MTCLITLFDPGFVTPLQPHLLDAYQAAATQDLVTSRSFKMREQSLAGVRLFVGISITPLAPFWCNAREARLDQELSVLPLYVTQATADILSL